MKRTLSYCVLAATCFAAGAQDWPGITTEARPGARWWWLGSAVDTANLTYNMEEYARAGLGALEITPIYGVQGNDANNIDYLSDRWMQMLAHTQAEGRRLGIEVDMNTGTGWPFGGPEVDISDAAAKAIFQTYDVTGGQKIDLDLSVSDERQRPVATLSRVMAYSPGNTQRINLTSKVVDGHLRWNAPAGQWTVIALYVGRTFQKVKRAAPGGEGYVMNHLDRGAVDRYLARFDRAFKATDTPFPPAFFNDSYEVYGADWTDDFVDQFARRRGYRIEDYFPEFLADNRNDTTARIVSDYRATIGELLIENFTRRWTDWAHRHGSITRNQAHGSPANLIDTYAAVDIPECEGFGLSNFGIKGLRTDSLTRKNDSDLSMLKYASSAAHVTGKPYTSSETFTWLTEHFRTSLAQCKPDIDLMFVSGVNHMFFHGTPYSPREARWPGWKFYASIDMSPTNSIWRDAPAFFDYITRCQSFLQMGRPDNDFLVYLPVNDMWHEQPGRLLLFSIHDMARRAPKFIETVNTIASCGYDMDYISDNLLLDTREADGRLVTPGGTAYKAIIVPAVHMMSAETLDHLVDLARNGATVIFTGGYPGDVPGLGHLDSRRKAMARAIGRLPEVDFDTTTVTPCGKGFIITGSDYASTLAASGIKPEPMAADHGLKLLRRSNDKGHHYFISCLKADDVDVWTPVAVDAADVMFFDPMTGRKGRAATRRAPDGNTEVHLQLKSGESMIMQTFDRPIDQTVEPWPYIVDQPVSLSLDHGWKLTFVESEPDVSGTFDIDTPRSWTEIDHPQAAVTMGTGLYSNTFTLPDIKADDWVLDLGDVRESARVRVNGHDAGTAWAVPYRLSVGQFLKPGINTVEIEVTNLPANRIADMDRRGEPWRIFNEINVVNLQYKPADYSDWGPVPSGLNSSVKLIPVNHR